GRTVSTSSSTPGGGAAVVGLRKTTETTSAVNVEGSTGRSNSMTKPVASRVPSGAKVLLMVTPVPGTVIGWTTPIVLLMTRGPAGSGTRAAERPRRAAGAGS